MSFKYFLLSILFGVMLLSCNSERYRRDKQNRMTKRAKIANDYLATQAEMLTQDNIDDKEKNAKAAHKRKTKHQQRLNEVNETSKLKPTTKHSGNFKLY